MLGSRGHNFSSNSNGDPIVARPFTNALNGAQDARQVAYPGQAFGALNFNAETRLYSIGLNYWAELVEDGCSCCSSACSECGRPQKSCGTSSCDRRNDRVLGLKLGPRFIHLDDTVLVDEMRKRLLREISYAFWIHSSQRIVFWVVKSDCRHVGSIVICRLTWG